MSAGNATMLGDRGATTVPYRGDRGGDWKPPARRPLKSRLNRSDIVFRAVARIGGSVMLAIMLLIGVFLAYRATTALRLDGWQFLTQAKWAPGAGPFGILAIMIGTFLIAGTAIAFAIPLSLGTALYISEYAPRSIQRFLISIIDLMAAVPSVVFGLWGFFLLQWKVAGFAEWLSTWFSWFPPFQVPGVDRSNPLAITPTTYTSSTFDAGLVVALMVTPVISSIMREAFSQAPAGEREGAYALGSTRWGMVRSVVLPFGRGAMIGGIMLGLGRAMGETMAVTLIIAPLYAVQPHILEHDTSSISSTIALNYASTSPLGISALMAAGLSLFAVTLLINFIAAQVVARSRSGAQSE